ncbi:DUF4277 domain-containing protein [Cardinium endosymbiont of Dermatophagoides farinae]|nr:DUF4277 domain-containing protein [Cardinium endosymbiont of Dermatophagoides farinae]
MFGKHNISGSSVLDHLGLVASTIEKLGIVNEINKRIPLTNGAKTTHGQRVSAMILNGLGFMNDRLYLFPKFLANKPVSKLLGGDVCASDFNDDALGRCLDAIHEYGITKLFSEVALSIACKHKLLGKSAHLDTTTLSVYGEYENNDSANKNGIESSIQKSIAQEDIRLHLPTKPIPAYGHAKLTVESRNGAVVLPRFHIPPHRT